MKSYDEYEADAAAAMTGLSAAVADTCAVLDDVADVLACEGHPAGPFDPMGLTVYCDGTCAGIGYGS